jgi:hypothetical protein
VKSISRPASPAKDSDDLQWLDDAAHANLRPSGFRRYEARKADLVRDGSPVELKEALIGWIWDEIEAEAERDAG